MKLGFRAVVEERRNVGLLLAIWLGLVGNCLAVPMIAIEILRMEGDWGGAAACMAATSVASVVCICELRWRVVKSHDACQLATLEDLQRRNGCLVPVANSFKASQKTIAHDLPFDMTREQAEVFELIVEANDAWFQTMSQQEEDFVRIHQSILRSDPVDESKHRFIEYALGILIGYAEVYKPITGYEKWVDSLLDRLLPARLLALAIKAYGYMNEETGDERALARLSEVEKSPPFFKEIDDALAEARRVIAKR